MLCFVIYDISSTKIRNRICAKCKDYGLKRVQKSAFLGEISGNLIEMLAIDLQKALESSGEQTENDCVFILPQCEPCFSKNILIGKGFDEENIRYKNYVIIR